MPNIAAIDIGSNAIRMLVASLEGNGRLTPIASQREALRLGKDVFASGSISNPTIDKAKDVFKKFRKTLDEYKVKNYKAVATSALREALNQRDFINIIAKSSDISINVIEGEEEARLVTRAVAEKIDLSDKFALLIDIGGGSIEISLVLNGDIISSDSVNLGTVRLLQILEEKKHGIKIFSRLVRGYADSLRRRLKKEIGKRTVEICVATGGNVEALASLKKNFFNDTDNSKIKARELSLIMTELQALSYEERIQKLSLKPDRADVIIPASIVLQQITEVGNVNEILVPGVGLKDGILLDILPEITGRNGQGLKRKQVLNFALELGRKFAFDEEHAQTVSALAASLFEQTIDLHKLSDNEKLLLDVASLLHDVGQCVNVDGHHKHSHYIIKSSQFIGLSKKQINIVAAVARYHRKAHPKMEHPEFSSLPADDRQVVRKLAAILRIAEALDPEHIRRVSTVKIEVKKSKAELMLEGKEDLILEKISLKSRCLLFEEVFEVKIQIRD